jgi:tetratricopeptide (TPR) repeat protein
VRSFKVSSQAAPATVDVQPLSPGAASVVLIRGRAKFGLKGPEAEQAAIQVRAIQTRFPGDELVETTLAEAELDAGHAAAARAAADRAIKANPRNTEALVLKGRAMTQQADALDDPARGKLFEEARDTFIAANKLDVEDPEPLMEYYHAYATEGVRPTSNAIAALHYASDLAPQDLGLRLNSAVAYLNEGKPKEARKALVIVAYSPHGGGVADLARRTIAKIDAGDAKGALMTAAGRAKD